MPTNVSTSADRFAVILAAPNVSEQMGGEAIKALQIYLELERQGVRVHQVTHERVKPELDRNFPSMSVSYVSDTMIEKLLYRGKLFEQPLNVVFMRSARERIRILLKDSPAAIVHFTSPVSPVLPYPPIPNARVIIGPVTAIFITLQPSDTVRGWPTRFAAGFILLRSSCIGSAIPGSAKRTLFWLRVASGPISRCAWRAAKMNSLWIRSIAVF